MRLKIKIVDRKILKRSELRSYVCVSRSQLGVLRSHRFWGSLLRSINNIDLCIR